MIKKMDHQVFYIVFEAVGGCDLEVSLWAHVVGITTTGEGLADQKVFEKTCIVE